MAYLLDANVFIEGKNTYYGMDFCPGFWDWIDRAHANGEVLSVERIGDELLAGQDALAAWARARWAGMFLPPDPPVAAALATVSAWATSQTYPPAAVSEFLQSGDYFLIAHALAHRHTVVTRELPGATRRIKIPDVCIGLGVPFTTPFEMLRRSAARLELG